MTVSNTFYRLRLEPLPEHICGIHNRKENFQWFYSPDQGKIRCEIGFLQEGSLSERCADGEHTYAQGTVHTIVRDRYFRQYCTDPVFHGFALVFTVAVPPEPITAEQAAAWSSAPHEAILPEHIEDYTTCQQIGKLIKSVIGVNNSDHIARGLRLRTALYECLTLATEQAVQQAQQLLMQNAPNQSVLLACQHIRAHLSENLNVWDVARAAGAKYSHLKRVFRQEMNMSMVDYINSARIQQVEKLIAVDGLSLAEAGRLVGISDPNYLSRLFRRFTGMTAREYRKIYAECRHTGFTPDGSRIPD